MKPDNKRGIDPPKKSAARPTSADLDYGRLLKLSLRAPQPLRVINSRQGPIFRLDYEKIAAQRAAARCAPRRPVERPGHAGAPRSARRVAPQTPAPNAAGPVRLQPSVRQKAAPVQFPFGGNLSQRITRRYRIREKLGEGGAGVVYKAQDQFLDMPVAIKFLNPQLTHDKQAVASLKAEARIAMRLSHPHIVHLHNLEKSGNKFFLVMEHIKGSTFRELLRVYGRMPLDTVIETFRVCSDALSYAHRYGVLHNDLKPENLLIADDGVLKVIDFGISCLINARQTDFIMGTPAYMSPEQIRGERLDRRTDVYSLGIMTYEPKKSSCLVHPRSLSTIC
ncbi:MAG: serine/threonine-protein kinase [Verrucomicrobiota bacterium]|nr:serine/threonine-protein kinase [Verrucomicrobiota bacterium]